MQTSELTGVELDLAVAKCEGRAKDNFAWWWAEYHPSTDWAHGGVIIEREGIMLEQWVSTGHWQASNALVTKVFTAETPLIAAMRCYVASKLGDDVDEADIQAWL